MENLTEMMRKLTEANKANGGKTAEQIAEEKAFIENCTKRNPFRAENLNCTNQMRLLALAPELAARLKEEAEIARDDRIAALEKAVRSMGGTLDGIDEKLED